MANGKDKATLKLVANILGNISAISVGIALYEKSQYALLVALIFAVTAVITIRSEE